MKTITKRQYYYYYPLGRINQYRGGIYLDGKQVRVVRDHKKVHITFRDEKSKKKILSNKKFVVAMSKMIEIANVS